MIRSTEHQSSDRRYKKERFRNQNFRKYQLIEDDNSDYENGAPSILPERRRKDIVDSRTVVNDNTHTNPFDLSKESIYSHSYDFNAFENIRKHPRSSSSKRTHNVADSQFKWINDEFEYKIKDIDRIDDVPVRVFPAHGKRNDFGDTDNDIKQYQSSRAEDGRKSYSTKVYRNKSRKATSADYERFMQPLTIDTTGQQGWTTSTTQAAKRTHHHGTSRSAVPAIVTNYGDTSNTVTVPVPGHGSTTTENRRYQDTRNINATPIHGYDNNRNTTATSGYGHREAWSNYTTTKTGGLLPMPAPGYGSIRHLNATPVIAYGNSRNVTETTKSAFTSTSTPSESKGNVRRQQSRQIVQKRDSGEYDNYDQIVVPDSGFKKSTQKKEFSYFVEGHAQSSRSGSSQAVKKTKQKSQTLEVPTEYIVKRPERSRARSSERLYKTESSDDSERDDFQLQLVGTRDVDVGDGAHKIKKGSNRSTGYQNQQASYQMSRAYTTQHVESKTSQKADNTQAQAQIIQKSQRLQVPTPYVSQRQNVTSTQKKSYTLQVPTEYIVNQSTSTERLYKIPSPDDSEEDDFKLKLVGTRELDTQDGIHRSNTAETGRHKVQQARHIQNTNYGSESRTQQAGNIIQSPGFYTQQFSKIEEGKIRTPPTSHGFTQHHETKNQRSKSFVQYSHKKEQRTQNHFEQEPITKTKGASIDRRMNENIAAFEESNRYLRDVVEQAEKRLYDLEAVQNQQKNHQLVQSNQQTTSQQHLKFHSQPLKKVQSSSYEFQYQYQKNNTLQGLVGTQPISPPPKLNTLDSNVSSQKTMTQSHGQVATSQTYGHIQKSGTTTQNVGYKKYEKTQNLKNVQTNSARKLQEMKKNELKEQAFKAQTEEKKSLLIKQESDEYDNLTIEDLINRDNEIKSQKVKNTNLTGKDEVNIAINNAGGQIYGQNLNGVKTDETDDKWLYKQDYYGSRETLGMNKDLKHDSAYYSYSTLNQDSHGYLNNGTKDTNGYLTRNDGYLSNSSSSSLYSSRKQSSSYGSRSYYGGQGQTRQSIDEGGLLYKTLKQKENSTYKRMKDNDIILERDGSVTDSYGRGPPTYSSRSQDGYSAISQSHGHERDTYINSKQTDIYSQPESKKKAPVDDKGGILFKAVHKSSSEKDSLKNTAVKGGGHYQGRSASDLQSSAIEEDQKIYRSGSQYDNSKHRDYYSRRSNLGMCCVQVKL